LLRIVDRFRDQLIEEARSVLRSIDTEGLVSVEAFGSFATGSAEPGDIDLLLHFEQPTHEQRLLSGTVHGRVHLVVVGVDDEGDLEMVAFCRSRPTMMVPELLDS